VCCRRRGVGSTAVSAWRPAAVSFVGRSRPWSRRLPAWRSVSLAAALQRDGHWQVRLQQPDCRQRRWQRAGCPVTCPDEYTSRAPAKRQNNRAESYECFNWGPPRPRQNSVSPAKCKINRHVMQLCCIFYVYAGILLVRIGNRSFFGFEENVLAGDVMRHDRCATASQTDCPLPPIWTDRQQTACRQCLCRAPVTAFVC
jgi:hypothetical protein